MAQDESFSIRQLPTYSSEQIQNQLNTFQKRADALSRLSGTYNDKAREALNSRSLPEATHWDELCKVAEEMVAEAQKKARACLIELDLRQP